MGRLAAVLTDGRTPDDLYSVEGARLYERIAEADDSERTEVLACVARTRGEILELACGGGRLTLPLLALGRPVVGLDLSEEMIRTLRDRYSRLPASRRRATLSGVVGDMSDFDLGRRVGSVVLATTSMLLVDRAGRRRMLACVRRHLAADGRFFVTVPSDAAPPGATSTRLIPLNGGWDGVVVLSDLVAADGRTRTVSALHVRRTADEVLDVASFSSVVQVAGASELDREITDAGFTRVGSTAIDAADAAHGLLLVEYSA